MLNNIYDHSKYGLDNLPVDLLMENSYPQARQLQPAWNVQ